MRPGLLGSNGTVTTGRYPLSSGPVDAVRIAERAPSSRFRDHGERVLIM
jgi:hypothetical protein